MDRVSQIMAFEQGDLDDEATAKLFQDMINDGSVWKLQGSYGRMAEALIREGICQAYRGMEPKDE